MTKLSSHLYLANGTQLGRDAEVLRRASIANAAMVKSGVRPILTLRHFARDSELSYDYLRKVVRRGVDDYETIKRKKDDGSFRFISSPRPDLMHAQRWLLEHVLGNLDLHEAAFAYRKGVSIVHCAEVHVGAKWLVKMDLHNFFGEISESRVYSVFRNLNLSPLLSFEIARICTRVPSEAEMTGKVRLFSAYSQHAEGVLPQGAPTSGAIANAVATALDVKLDAIASRRGFVYTRYSDDLTMSTHEKISRDDASKLIADFARAIHGAGFRVHSNKTRVITPGARKVVLGLLVGDRNVRLLPEFKRQVLNHIRGVRNNGLVAHAAHRRFRSSLSMVNYLDGCLAFAHGVDREWAAAATSSWREALTNDGFLDSAGV
ncbi:reverse transcriptase family protein [Cryobacterium sp. Y57]|uniref:reverse transcriptase family protein n=1 Tax=Cryobacterium sp. Y57 TaxID=2048287 RepID=UPI000CE418FA|nr:reverse transcriptase family protein [Cryobacterium sp. Y57]